MWRHNGSRTGRLTGSVLTNCNWRIPSVLFRQQRLLLCLCVRSAFCLQQWLWLHLPGRWLLPEWASWNHTRGAVSGVFFVLLLLLPLFHSCHAVWKEIYESLFTRQELELWQRVTQSGCGTMLWFPQEICSHSTCFYLEELRIISE